jgi:hypothetical protein
MALRLEEAKREAALAVEGTEAEGFLSGSCGGVGLDGEGFPWSLVPDTGSVTGIPAS